MSKLVPGEEAEVVEKLNSILAAAGCSVRLPFQGVRISGKGSLLLYEQLLLSRAQLASYGVGKPADLDRVADKRGLARFLAGQMEECASRVRDAEKVIGMRTEGNIVDRSGYAFFALEAVGYTEGEISEHFAGWKMLIIASPNKSTATAVVEKDDKCFVWQLSSGWLSSAREKTGTAEYALNLIKRLESPMPAAVFKAARKKFELLHAELSGLISGRDFDGLARESLISGETLKKASPWLKIAACRGGATIFVSIVPPATAVMACENCGFMGSYDVVVGDFTASGMPSEARSFLQAVAEEVERKRRYQEVIKRFLESRESWGRLSSGVQTVFEGNPWAWLSPVREFVAEAAAAEEAWQSGDFEFFGRQVRLGKIVAQGILPEEVHKGFIVKAENLARRLAASGCRADGLKVDGAHFSLQEVRTILAAAATHQNFGVTTLAALLAGSRSKRLEALKLKKSRHYGALSGRKQADIAAAIEALVAVGALQQVHKFYHDMPVLTVPAETKEWLERGDELPARQPDRREALDAAIASGDAEAVAALAKSDPALEFYLRAAAVLAPGGRAARMAKKALRSG